MASSLLSRNVTVAGHRTSMRLELEMWEALAEICQRERLSAHDLCTAIGARRTASSLTAALRVFVMEYFRGAATEEGHIRAGHGIGALDNVEPFRLPALERKAPAQPQDPDPAELRALR